MSNQKGSAENPTHPALDDAQVPGVVITHSPASSGRFIGSPSIAILPNGDYLASHDFFGPKAGHTTSATSVIFSSSDRGKRWQKIAEIGPLFWGKLFVWRDAVYILGTRHEYGDVLLRRSVDEGRSWTEPSDATTGLLRQGRYHCAPCPTLFHKGQIWRSMELFTGGDWGNFDALVMAASADSDLLKAENWHFSAPLPKQAGFSWLEGCMALTTDGQIVDVLRTNGQGDDRAAIVHVADEGKTLSFNPDQDLIDMPGGGSKFTIRYDSATARYWSIVSQQTNPSAYRNHLVLTSSATLRDWQVESPLLFHPDREKHAWQYIDWQFEGDDIIFISRTAYDDGLGGAHRAHDANYLTFHRIPNFRSRQPELLTTG